MRFSAIVSLLASMGILVVGLITVFNVHKRYEISMEIALLEEDNFNLLEERKKMRLEESMLITGALLDRQTRENLEMVIPDYNAIVYVIERPDEIQMVERLLLESAKN